MKILKMYVNRQYGKDDYNCVFDVMPEITYERSGNDYIGSATDKAGNVIFSQFLRYSRDTGAFGGRTLTLRMKDGTEKQVKDHWWDTGPYPGHGSFISIGADTLEGLQQCYVYNAVNINSGTFRMMADEYYSREREYGYWEIEQWVNMQHTWYPLIINGREVPVMVNEKGGFADKYTKRRMHPVHKRTIDRYRREGKTDKSFSMQVLRLEYEEGTGQPPAYKIKRRIECSLLDALMESLPFGKDEIVRKCGLKSACRVQQTIPHG